MNIWRNGAKATLGPFGMCVENTALPPCDNAQFFYRSSFMKGVVPRLAVAFRVRGPSLSLTYAAHSSYFGQTNIMSSPCTSLSSRPSSSSSSPYYR